MTAAHHVDVVLVTSLDAVARRSVVGALLLELPDVVCLAYEAVPGGLHRVASDRSGLVQDEVVELDHGCLSCTLRGDLVTAVASLATTGPWRRLVVVPPPSGSAVPLAHELVLATETGALPGAELAGVVALVDLAGLEHDLLGTDTVAERGLALSDRDERSVGEVVAEQVEFADTVVATSSGSPTDVALLRHVVAPTSTLHLDWTEVGAGSLFACSHDLDVARDRIDPMLVRAAELPDDGPVWTLTLESPRPLDPHRLLADIEQLGSGRIRARGHFWLASRPGAACSWDGAGGQLSIGHHGGWGGRRPRTRLVVTGVDPEDRHRIETAFAALVDTATPTPARWPADEDGFEPWLGELSPSS